MPRPLPPRPSLEHLKKQAKDLLDAHQRRDPEALGRIRAAVPAFAGMTDDAIAAAPFALHDAQSALAREHGLKSWAELRDAVAAKNADPPPPDELMRALMPLSFPQAVGAALQDAWARRGEAGAAVLGRVPAALPLVAMRDALFVPGALGPIHVGRAATKAAVEAALARTPPTLAVFAQRAPEAEVVDAAALYPIGCEAVVHARIPDAALAWVVLEGVRWIALEALEAAPEGYQIARVGPVRVEDADAAEVPALADALRATARVRASALPGGGRILGMIDTLPPDALADLVIANLAVPVADKARYAEERRLPGRLRLASALAGATAPPAD